MGEQAPYTASRPGTRTLILAIMGLGAAALVTSVSALHAGEAGSAVRYALWGGTAVNAAGAFLTVACAIFLHSRADRVLWAAAGAALALTTTGAVLRALRMSEDSLVLTPGFAEVVYASGALLLAVVLCAWPFTRRMKVDIPITIAEAAGAGVLVLGGLWVFGGQRMVSVAGENGAVDPGQFRQLLLFMMLLTAAVLFSTVALIRVRRTEWWVPWALMTLSMVGLIFGDVVWLWKLAGFGWEPGSFADFVHVSAHALMAVGGSTALDHQRDADARSRLLKERTAT